MASHTVSLVAAAAFGVLMATATLANGEINQQNQSFPPREQYCATQTFRTCVATCAPTGSTPSQRASCISQCAAREDPLDCMYVRQSLTVAPNATAQGAAVRR